MMVSGRGSKMRGDIGCDSLSLSPSFYFGDDESIYQSHSPTQHQPHQLCGTVHNRRARITIPTIFTIMEISDTHSCKAFINIYTYSNVDMIVLWLGAKTRHLTERTSVVGALLLCGYASRLLGRSKAPLAGC